MTKIIRRIEKAIERLASMPTLKSFRRFSSIDAKQVKRKQSNMISLLIWMAFASIFLAITFLQSTKALAVSTVAFEILVIYQCRSRDYSWARSAMYGGVALTLPLSCMLIAEAITEAELVQGELYHEDGPEAFFFVALLLQSISSFLCGMVGCAIGQMADLAAIRLK